MKKFEHQMKDKKEATITYACSFYKNIYFFIVFFTSK